MTPTNLHTEEALRNDREFAQWMRETLPNSPLTPNFTQQVMAKVALQPLPVAREKWYQSLSLWLIFGVIFLIFAGAFGMLFWLCDFNYELTFKVLISFFEKFEVGLPFVKSIFYQSLQSGAVWTAALLLGAYLLMEHLPRWAFGRR